MGSIKKNQDDVYSRMKNLNSSLNHVLKDLQSSYDHNVMGELDSTLLSFVLFTHPRTDCEIQLYSSSTS